MTQLLGMAQTRSLITDEEAKDFSNKVEPSRQTDILAQATAESVTAYQLEQRRLRKEKIDKGIEMGSKIGS